MARDTLEDGLKQLVSVRALLNITPTAEREKLVIRLHRAKVITLDERRAIIHVLAMRKLQKDGG